MMMSSTTSATTEPPLPLLLELLDQLDEESLLDQLSL